MGQGSRVSARTVWTVALNLVAIVAVVVVMRRASAVVSWVLVALLIALALNPVVDFLERHRWRRTLAVISVLLGFLLVGAVLVVSFLPMLVEQGQKLVQSMPALLDRLQSWSLVVWADEHLDVVGRLRRAVQSNAAALTAPVLGVLANLVHFLAGAVATFFLAAFMLLYGREVVASALDWIQPEERKRVRALLGRMRTVVGGYVAGSLVIAGIGGAVTTVVTLALGVPYFLPLGLSMTVLGLVPYVGVVIAGVLVIGVTLAAAGLKAGIITAIVFLAYQQLENHLLQPLVQRRTIKMNPLLIVLAMLFGTALFGILGAVLALPVAGAVQVLLRDVLARRQGRWGGAARSNDPDRPNSRPD